jgi:glyoxylase-like metal-dependent hydrolase (beta-lactamase superfamily II)
MVSANSQAGSVQRVLAPNPGPMTLDGTNSWIVGEPGRQPLIVDPGPPDDVHLSKLLEAAGGSAAEVWLTHHHDDHSAGAFRMGELAGCPVRAMDATHASDPELVLRDGTEQVTGSVRLIARHTPGHTSDSMCFIVLTGSGNVLITGDTVLGRGTTVIAYPDGGVGDYLDTLDRLIALVDEYGIERLLPGHGDLVTDPAGVLSQYRQHRLHRLDEIRRVLGEGNNQTAADVTARVYGDVDPSVWPAAEQSVRAQLHYLGWPDV